MWAEIGKLLSAPDPSRALLWMRQAGVLSRVLPETEKWGIDAIHGLVAAERDLGWKPDPLLRLAAMVPPDAQRMAALGERLRLSKAEQARLVAWASSPSLAAETGEAALRKIAYRGDVQGLRDRLRLALAAARERAQTDDQALRDAGGYSRLLKLLDGWERPRFPVGGTDLLGIGLTPGREIGECLKRLEDEWIASGFTLDRNALIERAEGLDGAD